MQIEYVPHDYQKIATNKILDNKKFAIFLEMGLGKTVITLTAISELVKRKEIQKVLVIAPLRVAQNVWDTEIRKWKHTMHLTSVKVIGTPKQRLNALKSEVEVYITNRENVAWISPKIGKTIKFDMLVIDELSSFKSHESKRFIALSKIRKKFKRIVGLTGTPAPNGLIDLWSQIFLLDGGIALEPNFYFYRSKYFNKIGRFKYTIKKGMSDKIYDKIKHISMSMKSVDHIKLPNKLIIERHVEMNDDEYKYYDTMEDRMIFHFNDKNVVAQNSIVLIGKLLQLANGAIYDDKKYVIHFHDRKLDELSQIFDAVNDNIIVFYTFKHDKDRILNKFPFARELKTNQDILDWNNKKIEMLIAHPAAVGHGLNLQQGGSTVVWFGLTWSLELYEQGNARVHRQGQKNIVKIYHILCEDTVDKFVMKCLKNKSMTQELLMDAVKSTQIKGENKHGKIP